MLHTGFCVQAGANRAAAVILAVGDHRPAIIFPGCRAVEFIAPLRAVFMRPQMAIRPQRSALGIAVSITPDFRAGAGLVHEWIVRWHAAIFMNANDLAVVVVQRLCVSHAGITVAERQKKRAIVRLDNPAAKMRLTDDFGLLPENHRYFFKCRCVIRKTR